MFNVFLVQWQREDTFSIARWSCLRKNCELHEFLGFCSQYCLSRCGTIFLPAPLATHPARPQNEAVTVEGDRQSF